MEKEDKNTGSWTKMTIERLYLPDFRLRVARAVGELASRWRYSDEELIVHVTNKVKHINLVIEKGSGFFGRLMNRMTREDPEYIVLDGLVVMQLHELIGQKPPVDIDINATYRAHHQEVRGLLERATKAVEARG